MKIRSDFVSNSSSSSFIVDRDLSGRDIRCALLTAENIYHIIADRLAGMCRYKYDKSTADDIVWMVRHMRSLYLTQFLNCDDLSHLGLKSAHYQGGENDKPFAKDCSHIILDDEKHPVWIYDSHDPEIVNDMPMAELVMRVSDKYHNHAAVSMQGDVIKINKKVYGAECL